MLKEEVIEIARRIISLILFLLIASSVSAALVVDPADGVVSSNGTVTFKIEDEPVSMMRVAIAEKGAVLWKHDSGWVEASEVTVDFSGFEPGIYTHQVVRIGGVLATAELYDFGHLYHETSAPFRFEAKTVRAGESWKTISFEKTFTNPVVVVKSIEGCEAADADSLCDFVVPRIKNITSTGFDLKLQLTSGRSLSEEKNVPYFVIEQGSFDISGFQVQAGYIQSNQKWGSLDGRPYGVEFFKPEFSVNPVVITSIASFEGSDAAATRNMKKQLGVTHLLSDGSAGLDDDLHIIELDDASDYRTGFVTMVDEPGFKPFELHNDEIVSYFAITPGTGSLDGYKVLARNNVMASHNPAKIVFAGFTEVPSAIGDLQTRNGTDWAILRHNNLSNATVNFMVTEKSGSNHNQEEIGFVLALEDDSVETLSASFTAAPESGAAPLEVSFDASESTGEIASYSWDFGDGSDGTGETITHTFSEEGEFTVKLTVTGSGGNTVFAEKTITVGDGEPGGTTCESNEDCLEGDGCFNGTCLHPLLTINKSKDQSIGFRGNEQAEITTIWTITNAGDHAAILKDLQALGCDGYTCSFEISGQAEISSAETQPQVGEMPQVLGLAGIEIGESLKIVQKVKNVSAPNSMKELELGLRISYTDEADIGFKTAESHRNVKVLMANLAMERFHFKYELGEKSDCVSWNDVQGTTGELVAPRVLFNWDFSAGESESIAINACEKNGTEFNYCDGTQFFISLLKKLNKINELNGSNTASLESFRAYLIKDNYSEDFRLDFDDYYNDAFFGAPSWYSGEWEKYVLDSGKLKFEPAQIPESGLFDVELEFAFDGAEYDFFDDEGEPSALITVKFAKRHSVGVETVDSPFYHLAFDGLVGTTRVDSDGETERKDYGIGFVNQDGLLKIASNETAITTSQSSVSNEFLTSKPDSFTELNLNERGNLLKINLSGKEIIFLPGQAMPVILGIESKSNIAQSFYSLFKREQLLNLANAPASYWTGVASSIQCTDFIGNALYYNEADKKASFYDSTCSVPLGRDNAFGFKWPEVSGNRERVFYKTIFYAPAGEQVYLKPACDGVQDSVSVFASPFSLASDSSQSLALQQTGEEIDSFKKLADGISQERVCMAKSGDEFVFFWNTEKLELGLGAAKKKIEESWQFNWSNYECDN